jgi:hypothetical protein
MFSEFMFGVFSISFRRKSNQIKSSRTNLNRMQCILGLVEQLSRRRTIKSKLPVYFRSCLSGGEMSGGENFPFRVSHVNQSSI